MERILIAGGQGKMGRLFARAFEERGYLVDSLDQGQKVEAARVAAADAVMLSVPMDLAVDVARQIAPLVRPDALLFDINSLKFEICRVMSEECPGEVVGTHPMFGPTVQSLQKQKIVLCPIKAGDRAGWLKNELGALGMEIHETTPETHDRMMATVQVLTHFNKMALAEAWRRCGVEFSETLDFVSPIYRLELAMVGRLFAQDPGLYADIELSNPWGNEVRENFLSAASKLQEILASGDREAFCRLFLEIRKDLHGFSSDAMELSDAIVDFMVHKPQLQK